MKFIDFENNEYEEAYFEGYAYLSSLEDYWFKISINGDDIEIEDIHDSDCNLNELKNHLMSGVEFYSEMDYESETLVIDKLKPKRNKGKIIVC